MFVTKKHDEKRLHRISFNKSKDYAPIFKLSVNIRESSSG